ncbi:MAG: NAD-dependent epimerase/dehydratase family protein [Syntrophobacteraceae bacterium]|jgi:nucleoside-diphosphate-sugar epimerase
MNRTTIAILGATSHIAKGLIYNFAICGEFNLHLYTRSAQSVLTFINSIGTTPGEACVIHEGYDQFSKHPYDVIINCVGAGTANILQGDFTVYFTLTEEYDNLAITYLLNRCHEALYLSFSSGAVYGREHSAPVVEDSVNPVKVNFIEPEDYYSIVRLNAEAKHRAYKHLKIVDLRLFSYFSRFIDLQDGYFITDLMNSMLKNEVLVTDSTNMIRDYLHPKDLFAMVIECIKAGHINTAFDVISAKPVEKYDILDYFSSQYGLKYETVQSRVNLSATGSKNVYCSKCRSAARIGYTPEFSSMDTIVHEAQHILSGFKPENGVNECIPNRY